LKRGAQPTDTVLKLLSKFNIEPAAIRRGEIPAPVVRPEPVVAQVPAPKARAKRGATKEEPAAEAAEVAAGDEAVDEGNAASAEASATPEAEAAEATVELTPEETVEVGETPE
jgi:hypothetical protein